MKWHFENIIPGIAVTNQQPHNPSHFNVPLLLIRVPQPHAYDGPDLYTLVALDDGYAPYGAEKTGGGMTQEQMADKLNDLGMFPVPKLLRPNGDVGNLPENRQESPFIVIGFGHQ